MTDELLGLFVTEARDLVQSAADDLLALERAPGDAARIGSAFRALHTLKGSAGLFDFAPMSTALHAAEDLMGALRDGRLAGGRATLDALLDCVGAVDGWVETINATGALPADAPALSRRLTAALAAPLGDTPVAPAPGAPAPAPAPGAPAPVSHTLGPATPWLAPMLARERAAVAAAWNAGAALTALRYTPDASCFFRGEDPLALLRAVPGLQAVHISAAAPFAVDWADPFTCTLVIEALSTAPVLDVRAALRLAGDQAACVTVEQPEALLPETGMAGEAPAPPAARTVRVDAAQLEALGGLVGELMVAKNVLAHLAGQAARLSPTLARALSASHGDIERLSTQLQRGVTDLRAVPLEQMLRRLPRLVRDTASRLGKQVRLDIHGGDTAADKTVVDALYEPLLHLLRNAVDHGIESPAARAAAGKPPCGVITLTARREGDQVLLLVHDDGRGLDAPQLRSAAAARGLLGPAEAATLGDAAALDLIFAPGFSTAGTVTDISGRGVGLDAVRRAMTVLGGQVSVAGAPGSGCRFRLAVPLAVAVTTVVIVRAGGDRFGIPMDVAEETARIPRAAIHAVHAGRAIVLRDRTIPLLNLARLLGMHAHIENPGDAKVLIAVIGDQRAALEVDGFGERMDVVLRPMSGLLAGVPGTLGTALLGDGHVLMVLDLPGLMPAAAP